MFQVVGEVHGGHAARAELALDAMAIRQCGRETGHGGVSHGRIRLASFGTGLRYSDDVVRRGRTIFRSMGLSYIQGTVRGPTGAQTVRFLIDSGAVYSLLPMDVWQAIGLVPKREMDFALADGTTIRRAVSECHISLPQGEAHTPVVLGQPGDAEPLLGIVTLEILGLVFDPFHRTLHPMRALLV